MKTILVLAMFLLSFQLQGAACKCNCDPLNRDLCASLNDLEHPCAGWCASSTPSTGPMFTACHTTKQIDEATKLVRWVTSCHMPQY